jgi:ketosteroid isomerase-like protein
MQTETKGIIALFYQAFARRDLDSLQQLVHPDVEFRAAENFIYAAQNPYLGPAAVGALIRRIDADWDGFTIIPEEILGTGEMVIARGRYRGTFKATGFALNAEFVHVFKFRDGKISLQHNYTDTAQFRDAHQPAQSARA